MNFMMENNAGQRPEETTMRKRFISICIIVILVCGIYKYAPIAETPKAKPIIALKYTDERVRISAPAETEDEISSSPESVQPETAQRQWQAYIQPDMPEPFIEVLRKYEEFTNADVQDINDEDVRAKLGDKWWYLYDELCMHGTEIRYSLTDLTGDGFPELIMGIGGDYFDTVYPKVVYYISPTEGIKMEFTTSYFSMDFYEGGIIEHISGGVDYTITYLQFQEETESWELADRIMVEWDSQDDSESYYWGVNTADFSDPDNEPMSEEEYREIIERYTAEPVELEWSPLFGGEESADGIEMYLMETP